MNQPALYNCLKSLSQTIGHTLTIGEVRRIPKSELLSIKNFGRKSYNDLMEALSCVGQYGLG